MSFDNISVNYPAAALNNPYGYAGYVYDKETGLYYLNARMYDPVTARFLQEDSYTGTADDPLSLNLYTYCHNEPIMYTDPSGYKYVRKYIAPGYTDLVWEEDHWWEKVGNAVSSIADWTNNNVVNPAASWGSQQIENFKTGVDALSSWDKFNEAMDLINTYGSDSDKIVGAITGGFGRNAIMWKDATVGVTKAMFVDAPLETSAIILTGAVAINGNKSLTDETWRRTHDTIKAVDNFIERNLVTDKQSYETGQFTGMAGNLALGLGGLIEGGLSLPKVIRGIKTPESITNIFGGTAREASTGMKMSDIPDDFGKMNIEPITPNTGVSEAGSTLTKVERTTNNGLTYRTMTGSQGELRSVFAKIELQNIGKGTSTNAASREFTRSLGDMLDDAGHGIGKDLGGPGGARSGNLFPQNPSINRGIFKAHEQAIVDEVMAGNEVFVRIVPRYLEGATRPYEVLYQTRINGQTVSRVFDNPLPR